MRMKWKAISLVSVLLVAGCGGSDGGNTVQSSDDAEFEVTSESVDAPNCSGTSSVLSGCWVTSCDPGDDADSENLYARSIVAFGNTGELRHYMQAFDNANCVGPGLWTEQLFSGITFEVLPRMEGEDLATVEGRIEFQFAKMEEIDGFERLTVTPYDITDQSELCFDHSVVHFYSTGWSSSYEQSPTPVIDYTECLTTFN